MTSVALTAHHLGRFPVGSTDTEPIMPPAGFLAALDFLERSGNRELRLLSGEPTFHPDFNWMLTRALQRGFRVLVWSGGWIPHAALRKLESVPEDRLTVLVRVAVPGEASPHALVRQAHAFDRLGPRASPALEIRSPSIRLEYLLELIERHGLARRVRLTLVHPELDGDEEYLHGRHYPEVGRRVAAFAFQAREVGVALEFGCGWVPCMFPSGALEELGVGSDEIGLSCRPLLDVRPDGQVVSCGPLSAHQRLPLPFDEGTQWLGERFRAAQAGIRPLGLFRACGECDWRARGECTGGCLAGALRRRDRESVTVGRETRKGLALPLL